MKKIIEETVTPHEITLILKHLLIGFYGKELVKSLKRLSTYSQNSLTLYVLFSEAF